MVLPFVEKKTPMCVNAVLHIGFTINRNLSAISWETFVNRGHECTICLAVADHHTPPPVLETLYANAVLNAAQILSC